MSLEQSNVALAHPTAAELRGIMIKIIFIGSIRFGA
jgi:hypothetical protein